MLLENKIMSLVEEVKYKTKYTKNIQGKLCHTNLSIHLLVHSEDTDNFRRINLAKIFDGIITPIQKISIYSIHILLTEGQIIILMNKKWNKLKKTNHKRKNYVMVSIL